MAQIVRSAALKWGVVVSTSSTKEFFDQQWYRTPWRRMNMFDDVESQLKNRLEGKELGLSLPSGNEKMHHKSLKHIDAPEEHARAMVLLQRTQELSEQDWETF
jgi:hypothetical protein